ncbi:MAG: M24 family metallopeptidase [Nanoarchaeota archaeon]
MIWNNIKIKNHREAAELLNKIKDTAFEFISKNRDSTEYRVQQFILNQFKKYDLKTDKDPPIVAFKENSAIPHYFPSKNSKKLKPNSLILIDIWAKLNKTDSPFADITWVAYYGNKVPKDILRTFDIVISARNDCINCITSRLKLNKIPTGKEIDEIASKIIIDKGYRENILHRTGHCIGYTSPHGTRRNIDNKNNTQLLKNLGYTIEPGIYLKNKFGIRSEINFFIDENMKLIITTNIQNSIVIL